MPREGAYLAGYLQRLHFHVAGRIGGLSSNMEGGSSSAKLTWGADRLDGELPLNTIGGSLGMGRSPALWHIVEGAQVSGRAGSRPVKDANVSFVGAGDPIVTGTTYIFVGAPYRTGRLAA